MAVGEKEFIPIRIAVLTVSDTRGLDEDRSGQTLVDRLEHAGHTLADRKILRDSKNGADQVDTVHIRRNDGSGNESFDVLIEIRYFAANACQNWDLIVTSDTAVAAETCPAP